MDLKKILYKDGFDAAEEILDSYEEGQSGDMLLCAEMRLQSIAEQGYSESEIGAFYAGLLDGMGRNYL